MALARMRGKDEASGPLFSRVNRDARIPAPHPLRTLRQEMNPALASPDAEFEALCTDFAPRIAPERLIRILFPARPERQLMEQMLHDLLSRCFAGPGIDDPVPAPTVTTTNRNRLLTGWRGTDESRDPGAS